MAVMCHHVVSPGSSTHPHFPQRRSGCCTFSGDVRDSHNCGANHTNTLTGVGKLNISLVPTQQYRKNKCLGREYHCPSLTCRCDLVRYMCRSRRRVRGLEEKDVVMTFVDTLGRKINDNSHHRVSSRNLNWAVSATDTQTAKSSTQVFCQTVPQMRCKAHQNCSTCIQNPCTDMSLPDQRIAGDLHKCSTSCSLRRTEQSQPCTAWRTPSDLFSVSNCDLWMTC